MWSSPIGLIITFALGILVVPRTSTAQPPSKVFRIGVLSFSVTAGRDHSLDGLQQCLRALGYAEGQNLALAQRDAEGHSERLPDLAATLVDLRVEVLVALGAAATRAAQRATSTIPIVMVTSADP